MRSSSSGLFIIGPRRASSAWIGSSGYRAIAPSGHRAIGSSRHRAIAPSGHRAIGPSGHFGLLILDSRFRQSEIGDVACHPSLVTCHCARGPPVLLVPFLIAVVLSTAPGSYFDLPRSPMRACPQCQRTYPDDTDFCLRDGAPPKEVAQGRSAGPALPLDRGWRPDASGRPTNTGNISVTASYPWPVRTS